MIESHIGRGCRLRSFPLAEMGWRANGFWLILLAWAGWLCGNAGAMTYESPLSGTNKLNWFISFFVDHGDGVTPLDYAGGEHSYRTHGGMDIMLLDWKTMDEGIEVRAAAPGTVCFVQDGYFDRYTLVNGYPLPGNWVTLRHPDGYYSTYYHLARLSVPVTNGQSVAAGQKLGLVGSPGLSGGPHLHFQVDSPSGRHCEVMTNDSGQVQNFGWFDSYSSQVVRQILAMGLTTENDPELKTWEFNSTPRAYSIMPYDPNFGFRFGLWLKYVGFQAGDRLAVRMLAVSGPGSTIDLTAWPYAYSQYVSRGRAYWLCTVWPPTVAQTTYRLQYRWNGGTWQDAPGQPDVVFDNDRDAVCADRTSRCRTRYVSERNATPQAPFESWATAAVTIQDAIDAAGDGDTVVVSNGVYAAGGRVAAGAATRVAVTKAILVYSVNGPDLTAIVGDATTRCACVAAGGVLAGFTLTNGVAQGDGVSGQGGGAWCESNQAVVCNSKVVNNIASEGGGVYGGTLFNCLLTGNLAALSGGGARSSALTACTVADNAAGISGGGVAGCSLYNSIACFNAVSGQDNNVDLTLGGWVSYSCTTPLCAGVSNLAVDPVFADRAAGDYRLAAQSSCVGAGNGGDIWTCDLDGRSRVIGTRDLGTYEYAREIAVPDDVRASAGLYSDRVQLEWSPVDGAVRYEVWRHPEGASRYASRIGESVEPSFSDTTASPAQRWGYSVRAASTANVSAASAAAVGWRQEYWQPGPADYDGDGKTDPAVYRPSDGTWQVRRSAFGYDVVTVPGLLGGYGWQPAASDYDGDRLADPAVYQDADGSWQVLRSSTGYGRMDLAAWFGAPGLLPASADYDGDRQSDPAVYDSIAATWAVRLSGVGYGEQIRMGFLGGSDWAPAAADYDGDGLADPVIYRETDGAWIFLLSTSGYAATRIDAWLGGPGWSPAPGDYDGDGRGDPAIFGPDTGTWILRLSTAGYEPLELNGFLGTP